MTRGDAGGLARAAMRPLVAGSCFGAPPGAPREPGGACRAAAMTSPALLLSGGLVLDGSGSTPPRPLDVLLSGGTVAAVFPREAPARRPAGSEGVSSDGGGAGAPAALRRGVRQLDCNGMLVAPGFIDIHTHSDLTWLSTPGCESRITQGITTEVTGNCGMSPAPRHSEDPSFRQTISVIDQEPDAPLEFASFIEFLETLGSHRAAGNIAPLVGHGSARQTALFGTGADAAETGASVTVLVERALSAGAWGTSLGLMYPPGESADSGELQRVAEVTAVRDALLAVHMRDYRGEPVLGSIEEMCRLQELSGVSLELSHLRAVRAADPDVVAACLQRLDAAGARVGADAYPYSAGQTTLFQMLAVADRREGIASFLAASDARRREYAAGIEQTGFAPEDIHVVRSEHPGDAWTVGRSLAECAEEAEMAWPELAVELLRRSRGYVDVVVFGSRPAEQEQILRHEKVMIGSDGFTVSSAYPAALHPRAFGAFPRALRLLVDGGMPWERAVAKATGEPARKLGLSGRGLLHAGCAADVTVFYPSKLADRATYERPLQPATGIRHVLVAGVPVLEDGRATGARPGALLLRPDGREEARR